MVHGCKEMQPLLPNFSCSAPFPQSSGLCPPNDSSNPHLSSALQNHQPVEQIPACPSPCFRSPTGFLSATRLSGWLSILGKNWNFRGERGNVRTWSIFHCLGNKDSGLSPLGYTKEKIKAVVDMVGIESEEGSSSHAELWVCVSLVAEVSARSKAGSGIYKSACARLCGSRVCIYYKEKLQMETTQFGVWGLFQSLLKSVGVIPHSDGFWPHLSLPLPNIPMTSRAAACCIASIKPCEQWGCPCSPEWLLHRGTLDMPPALLSHPADTERQVLLIHHSLLKIPRCHCLIWFGKLASPGRFFPSFGYFYLNTLQHHLPPQEPDLRSGRFTILLPSSSLSHFSELCLNCL